MTQAPAISSFAYMAVRPGGGKKFGMRQARNVPALADALRMENHLLLKYWRLPAWAGKEAGLGLKDQATLNDQLGQLLSRGVPLVEALEVVAGSVRGQAPGKTRGEPDGSEGNGRNGLNGPGLRAD